MIPTQLGSTGGTGRTTSTASTSTSVPRPRATWCSRSIRNEADWGHQVAPSFFDPSLEKPLYSKYGVNRERFFVKPGFTVRLLVFNASRPLFRDNPDLRRAVNHALDRSTLSGGPIAVRTDQYLPHAMPGFGDADVYPLLAADLGKATELARGHTRGGKAVMYTTDYPPPMATAMTVRQQLAGIGLDVEVKAIPEHIASAAYACAKPCPLGERRTSRSSSGHRPSPTRMRT